MGGKRKWKEEDSDRRRGGGAKRGRGRGRGGGGGGGGGRGQSRNDGWYNSDPIVKENKDFEEYYKEHGIVPEGEFDAFLDALRRPLPATFRINGGGRYADQVHKLLMKDFVQRIWKKCGARTDGDGDADGSVDEGDRGGEVVAAEKHEVIVDGEKLEPPEPLPWYPGERAFRMNCSKKQLRKMPELEALHEFVKRENEFGSITRQEEVSMIPPFFMDVEPHHNVLDLCASPGSKSLQLIEALHAGLEKGKLPSGVFIANDVDYLRCNLLNHQTKKALSPNTIIAQHDARHFPSIPSSTDESGSMHFDRILCDVPCSADGTLRKNADIWMKWSTKNGNGLHWLQAQIAIRAVQLLKVGGIMVYSTCSFNPIEDEAIVQAIVRGSKGAMRIVDASARFPKLRRMPGLKTWKVRDNGRWYASAEDAIADATNASNTLRTSMFPDTTSGASDIGLEHCMRFLPHHQDSGGFFVTVLVKDRALDADAFGQEIFATLKSDGKVPTNRDDEDEKKKKEEKEKEKEKTNDNNRAAVADTAVTADAGAVATDAVVQDDGEGTDVKREGPLDEEEAGPVTTEPPCTHVPDTTTEEADANPDAATNTTTGKEPTSSVERFPRRGRWKGVDACNLIVDPVLLGSFTSCFGLSSDFNTSTRLIVRSVDPSARPKKIYSVSSSVAQIVEDDPSEKLRIFACGVRMFERQDGKVRCHTRVYVWAHIKSLVNFL